MQKIYCDRCGKEIAKKPVTLLRHRVHYGETRIVDSKSLDDYRHDLCLDCENSFVLWYNHPEKDGGENDA